MKLTQYMLPDELYIDRQLWHFMVCKIFHGDSQGNTQRLHVSGRAIAVDLELTWQHLLSEFHPKQTRAVCVNRFHLSLWASMAARMITSSRSNNCYLARTTNYQLPTSSATLLPNNIAISFSKLSPPTTCPNPQCLLSSSIVPVSPTQIPCTINTRKCILYMYFIPITQHVLPTKSTSLLVGIQKLNGP